MKQIRIVEAFEGYPDGQTPRDFTIGEEPTDLTDEYADLLVAKGLAEEIGATTAAAPISVEPAQTDLVHLDPNPEHDA